MVKRIHTNGTALRTLIFLLALIQCSIFGQTMKATFGSTTSLSFRNDSLSPPCSTGSEACLQCSTLKILRLSSSLPRNLCPLHPPSWNYLAWEKVTSCVPFRSIAGPNIPYPPTTCHDALFTPAHSSAIVHVQLPLEHWLTGREVNFDLLIPRRVILQHARLGPVLDGRGELTYTEPSKWFHKGRLIKARSMAKGAVYGSRCITKEAVEGGLSVAAIYDFRPLPTALYDLGHDEDVEFILEDGWDVSDIFEESQRTAAPYRRIKSNIILKDDEYPQLMEDGIVIMKRTGLNSYR